MMHSNTETLLRKGKAGLALMNLSICSFQFLQLIHKRGSGSRRSQWWLSSRDLPHHHARVASFCRNSYEKWARL